MNKVNLKKEKEELVLDIIPLSAYEDFDKIIEYLRNRYNVDVSRKLDGLDMRVLYFTLNDVPFKLYNDPYGNSLICSPENNSLMTEIADNFENDL
jgi:hypothetical protein